MTQSRRAVTRRGGAPWRQSWGHRSRWHTGWQSLKGTGTGTESDAVCRRGHRHRRAPLRQNLQQEEQ